MSLSDILKSTTPKYHDIVPSTGKKIWYRPFLVKEEKILLIAQEMGGDGGIMKAVKEVVESCFEGLGDASKIPIFDLEYLFIKLRAKSVQEIAIPILICPVTSEEIQLKINLQEIKVVEDKKHSNKIKLSDDIVIGMKYPSISIFLENNIESMELMDFYELAINCIDYIETKEEKIDCSSIEKNELKEFVDNMTKQQFDKIIDFFATMPKLEKTVNYKTSDGEDRSIVLRGIKDFFGLASVT
jgi:hypothetical protein